MQFAIVGDCVEAVFLAEAIHESESHQIKTVCVSDALALEMTARGISFTLVHSAEEAVQDPACDVVIVAATDVEQSITWCRQASQAGQHVLVIPPHNVSTAFSFELHLLLDESEKNIVPLSGRWYVNWPEERIADLPQVQQVNLGFPLVDTGLEQAQLHGVDALCGCGYEFSQVTALDMPGADGRLLSRSVTLAASAASEQKVPPATLLFSSDCEEGPDSAALIIRTLDGQRLQYPTALPAPERCRCPQLQARALQTVVARLQDVANSQLGMEQFSNTLELMEALQKSLRRRRTVDVYFDGVSERSAFKTQMTAIGCGVLTYLMFGLVAFLVVAQVAAPPDWVLQIGRIVWITPLVLFLMAQLLLPLARERSGKTKPTEG